MNADTPTTVALVSLGCPKNLVDSEHIMAQLAEAGMVVGAEPERADIIVVNTCGFLAAARDESIEVIRQAVALKTDGDAKRVVVAGCLAQRDGEALRALEPGIDAIVGVNNRGDLARAAAGDKQFTAVDTFAERRRDCATPVTLVGDDRGRLRLTPPHTAYLRISEGCGQGCTFCTIPAITGPFRSKPAELVLDEARELIADGATELNIIGQDTTSYGRDLGCDAGLAGLLRQLNALDGARWIRLMYAYPTMLADEIIAAIAECDHVLKYIDLPLQHVADKVLAGMRRRITRAETEALLRRLRQAMPDLALRTTFIVGFPGEGEAEFNELLEFVEAFRFDAMGVFEYSKEPDTPAAKLADAVPGDVARARQEKLMLAQQAIAFAAAADRTGQEMEVLVDGIDPHGRCVGRHAGQAPEVDSICYLTEPRPAGKMTTAKVVDADEYDLIVKPSDARRRGKRKRRASKRR